MTSVERRYCDNLTDASAAHLAECEQLETVNLSKSPSSAQQDLTDEVPQLESMTLLRKSAENPLT